MDTTRRALQIGPVLLAATLGLACGGQQAPPAAEQSAGGPAAAQTPAPGDQSRNAGDKIFRTEPQFREVTVPAGTVLAVALETPVASDASRPEEPVRARLRRAVVVDEVEAIPAGAELSGAVTSVQRSGRVRGRAQIGFRLTALHTQGERIAIRTAAVSRQAPATKKDDAVKIAVPAAAGAVAGGIIGGKDDAAKGAAIGGAAGTGYVLATRGQEVRLAAGTTLNVRLTEPLTLRVPIGG